MSFCAPTTYKWVNPVDIHQYWPVIKEGVESICKSHDHWIPEDLYTSIKTGSINCHVGYIGNRYVGFITTQQQQAETGNKLHVWAAYSSGRDFDILSESVGKLKEWAANINANRITFSTTRKGWEKQAPKLGFNKSLITYEMQL